MYRIIYRKDAAKGLSKLPVKIRDKFVVSFGRIAVGQEAGLDIKKLEGRDGLRLRVGGYRALYRQLDDVLVIDVIKIGSRGDVYK
ncbi:type II toxin-antitoxin system RelE/ParE family toxin [Methylotuvimicrobium sp. KM2]|jgi:mRNA interferase RelE/StbE|uniref:type II toxin-antitoxin system RelE family toxin n=1 Tax=Methylotuvimicrobium sp. KM2 TaxID=3133976 RepID=UPI003101B2DA